MTLNILGNVKTPDDGYRALASAVVLKALTDYRNRPRRWRNDARTWLISDNCIDWCAMLDLNVDLNQIKQAMSS